jgi:hypothetical protein
LGSRNAGINATKYLLIVYFYMTVACPIDHGKGSGMNPHEIEMLTSGKLCGSLDACFTCPVVQRGEQAITAVTLIAGDLPLIRSSVGELT